MKMKKLISGVFCCLMLFSACIGVSAENITTDGGVGETVITYGSGESFTITIPSDIHIGGGGTTSTSVSASNVMIGAGKVLEVRVSGDDYVDAWELIDSAEDTNRLAYGIKVVMGNNDFLTFEAKNNDVILTVKSGEVYHSQLVTLMDVFLKDTVTKAGSYSDTLTFTVDVIEEAANS